jgi:hypothetical protein
VVVRSRAAATAAARRRLVILDKACLSWESSSAEKLLGYRVTGGSAHPVSPAAG